MPDLSLRNIDQIRNDIRNEEITFSHLLDDLIDHVCCDVEYEMRSGLDFHDAYRRVKQKIGSGRRIREIQEETLYAVDSKYRKMKNTMKISGIAGTLIFGCATLFKIQHWPGAGILLTLGALILAFVFMPSVTGVLWKETHNKKKLVLIISGFITAFLFISGTLFKIQHWPVAGILLLSAVISTLFVFLPALLSDRLKENGNPDKRSIYIIGTAGFVFYVLGMLFKIQHWPLSSVLMILGLVILGFVAFPFYTWITWKEDDKVSARFIFIVLGSLLIMIPGALINLNLQSMYERGYYPLLEQQQKLFEVKREINTSILAKYHDSLEYKQMEQIDSKILTISESIGEIQKQMVEVSESNPAEPVMNPAAVRKTDAGTEIIYSKLTMPFNPQPAKDFLFPGSQKRQELTAMIDDLIKYVSTILPAEETEKVRQLLNTSSYLPGEDPERENMLMLSGLHSLEVLRNNLLTAESILFGEIANQ
ncbi:MAG: hypothetical protein HZB98_00530 [Bacteroidia bacterium]|nr:hypothetical protein [Bacteroidia bacterium]